MGLRDDVSILLTYVQRTAAHARATYDRMGVTFNTLNEGRSQVASAGEGSESGGIKAGLDQLLIIMEHLKVEQEALRPIIEATEDLSQRFGFERSPERLESNSIVVGGIAVNLHRAAEEM